MDARGADAEELSGDGPGVIVRHAMMGGECDIVATSDEFPVRKPVGVELDDLFRECLRGGGREVGFGEQVGRGVGKLGGEGIQDFGAASRDGGVNRPWPVMEVCCCWYASCGPLV